jgi:hypothetical protein
MNSTVADYLFMDELDPPLTNSFSAVAALYTTFKDSTEAWWRAATRNPGVATGTRGGWL